MHDRAGRSKNEAQRACAVARELGILKSPGLTWPEFRQRSQDAHFGTEHLVELSPDFGRVAKITIPPKFGLVPKVVRHAMVSLRDSPPPSFQRSEIEFLPATPIEYLDRWIAANDIFGDDVQVSSVIEWADGLTSFAISQPQYNGVLAEHRDIERFFAEAGWTRLAVVSGHTMFFNYAFGVLAIDALPRNCYLHNGVLQPFDVILCKPDEDLEQLLELYPG